MTNLLTWRYWFTLRPESLSTLAQNCFVAFLIILVLIAFFVALAKRKGGIYRGFFRRVYSFCLSNAVIGLVFLFFNYEMVPFFTARFWLALWAIVMVVWFVFIIKKLKTIPEQKKMREQEKELKKYLP